MREHLFISWDMSCCQIVVIFDRPISYRIFISSFFVLMRAVKEKKIAEHYVYIVFFIEFQNICILFSLGSHASPMDEVEHMYKLP